MRTLSWIMTAILAITEYRVLWTLRLSHEAGFVDTAGSVEVGGSTLYFDRVFGHLVPNWIFAALWHQMGKKNRRRSWHEILDVQAKCRAFLTPGISGPKKVV